MQKCNTLAHIQNAAHCERFPSVLLKTGILVRPGLQSRSFSVEMKVWWPPDVSHGHHLVTPIWGGIARNVRCSHTCSWLGDPLLRSTRHFAHLCFLLLQLLYLQMALLSCPLTSYLSLLHSENTWKVFAFWPFSVKNQFPPPPLRFSLPLSQLSALISKRMV